MGTDAVDGTVDLQLPRFPYAVVRCRISRCINTEGESQESVKRFLDSVCTWQQTEALGIGAVPAEERGRSLSPKARLRAEEHNQRSISPPSGCRTAKGWTFKGEASMANVLSEWSFIRHLPGGGAALASLKQPQLVAKGGELHGLQCFYSDIAALLRAETIVKELAVEAIMTAEAFMAQVPSLTLARWCRVLKCQDDSLAALQRRITRSVALKTNWFEVVWQDGDIEEELPPAMRLVHPQPLDSPVATPGAVSDLSIGWVSCLPVLTNLVENASAFAKRHHYAVNQERLLLVASALERAESGRNGGGQMILRDRLCHDERRVVSPGGTTHRPRRNGRGGLSSEWMVSTLAEVSDPDRLEAGDAVRLLAVLAAENAYVGQAPPVMNAAAWSSFCNEYSLSDRSASRRHSKGFEELNYGEAMLERPDNKEELIYTEAEEALLQGLSSIYAAKFANFSRAAAAPLVMEVLLQGIMSQTINGTEALAGEILWRNFGWDSPVGRRLVRKLCRVYNRYASGSAKGSMSKAAYLRLCADAGWATQKDISGKQLRFATIFDDAVGNLPPDGNSADFFDFIYIVELVAAEVIQPICRQSGGPDSFWHALDLCVLQCSTVSGAASQRRRNCRTRAAHTARQKPVLRAKIKSSTAAANPKAIEDNEIDIAEDSVELLGGHAEQGLLDNEEEIRFTPESPEKGLLDNEEEIHFTATCG